MITLNARLNEGANGAEVVAAIERRVHERSGGGHASVEVGFGTVATNQATPQI